MDRPVELWMGKHMRPRNRQGGAVFFGDVIQVHREVNGWRPELSLPILVPHATLRMGQPDALPDYGENGLVAEESL